MNHSRGALALAVVLVLAGCSGFVGGGERGTLQFYVSDQQNAIDDFEHLNVTVTKVGLKRAGCQGCGPHEDHNHTHRDKWTVYDVPNQTVDLTRLQGENATRIDSLPVANGTYKKVFVYVSDVNATLRSGNRTDVKLPRDRLVIKKRFTVGNGEEVSFVFDVTVVQRDDGQYVLKPRVSQSGTNVEMCRMRDGSDGSTNESCDCGGGGGGMGGDGDGMHNDSDGSGGMHDGGCHG